MPVYRTRPEKFDSTTKCSVCLKGAENTKQLSCAHAFCQACLSHQISRLTGLLEGQERVTIVCPYCRDYFMSLLVAPADRSGRNSMEGRRFVDFSRPKTAPGYESKRSGSYAGDRKAQRCQPCAEGSAYSLASFWCQHCSEYFCSVCSKYHQAMKMAKDHIVKTIRDKERYGDVKSKVYSTARPQTAVPMNPTGRSCEPCKYNGKTKECEVLCRNCSEYMCGDCAKCHHSMKMSKSHKLSTISEILTKADSSFNPNAKCDRHKDEVMSLYCKSCRTSCCSFCAISLHSGCGKATKKTPMKTRQSVGEYTSGSNAHVQETSDKGPIKYSWDQLSKKLNDDKTVSFSIKPVPGSQKPKQCVPKNRMELRKKRIEVETSKENDWIISFAVLKTGDILFIQLYEPFLTMITGEGDFVSRCKFYGDPWSVGVCKDSLAVVSFSDRKQLQLVNITRTGLETGKKLSTRHKCLSVCFANNFIVASCWEGCVHVLNILGDELSSVDCDPRGERLFTNPEYIASDVTGSTIYVSDYKRNCVTALNLIGGKIQQQPVFIFTDKELQGPKGVAIDKYDVIYVSGMSSRNIFRLTSSGDVIQVYRRREDREYYEAIAVTSQADKLLVSAYEDSVIIEYKLKSH